MSFFDGFSSILSSGLGAAASFFGQQSANNAMKDASRDQMAFQERMSNTAHQREVDDLIAAGLNPILAAGGSGASSPSGSTFTAGNSGAAAASGAAQVMTAFSSSAKALAEAASTEAGMPLKKMTNTIPDLINQGVERLKSFLNSSAQSDSIDVRDLPAFGDSPSSAQAAGTPATGSSESSQLDWLTQLVPDSPKDDSPSNWDAIFDPWKYNRQHPHPSRR